MSPEIRKALRYCPNLPSPPRIAIEIVELCRDPEVDLGSLSRLLARDPALASRILRASNSVFYGQRRRCNNLRQAMLLIGLNATMTLALSFSLGTALHQHRATAERINFFWRRALVSASASRLLGEYVGTPDPEELFLAGLLQDIGILALHAALPDTYGPLLACAKSHDQLRTMEREALGTDHGEAGAWLMEHWGLPERMVLVASAVHEPETASIPKDAQLLVHSIVVAGEIADLFLGTSCESGTTRIADAAGWLLGMRIPAVEAVLSQVVEVLPDIAALYETEILSGQQATGIVDQAREILAVRNLQLVHQLTEQQRKAEEAARASNHLREAASRDSLTGLHNRRHFDETLETEFELATENGWPLTLGFIDVDHFKRVNDEHGHLAGDAVLTRIAKILQKGLRQGDFIMRYGGDEFVAILPGTGLALARKVFERLRRNVNDAVHEGPSGDKFRSTVSIGLASHQDGNRTAESALDLVRLADRALYKAKSAGRNCIGIEAANLDDVDESEY